MRLPSICFALAATLSMPSILQAQSVVIEGQPLPLNLSLVESSQVGDYQLEFNADYSLMPFQAYFSGSVADVLLINLTLQSPELDESSYSEYERTEILESLHLVNEVIHSGDQLLMHELFGEIENLDEISCTEASNTFVLILEKENENSLEATRILGNCAEL